MAHIGLKDLYVSKITETDGVSVYGTPYRLAKAISADLSVELITAKLHADDAVDENIREFDSGSLKLNINDILPEQLALLLGQTVDGDNVVYSKAIDEAPYYAVGFRAKKPGGYYKYLWLYRGQFTIPSESYKTKGESIEFTTPEITYEFEKRADESWRAEVVALPNSAVAAAWFTAVKEYTAPYGAVSPASFDKKSTADGYVDVVVTMYNCASVSAVKEGVTSLIANTDYSLDGTTITLETGYLETLAVGTVLLSVVTNTGTAIIPIVVTESA